MLRLSQYLQSNSFQKQLFNNLKGVCVFVKTSTCARRYYQLLNKKIAIYFDNGDCSMHANYKQISKSICNTKKVFCYIFFCLKFHRNFGYIHAITHIPDLQFYCPQKHVENKSWICENELFYRTNQLNKQVKNKKTEGMQHIYCIDFP